MASDRTRFLQASWVNVLGNIVKIIVEGSIGLTFGSLALVADAAHSLADLLASAVVLLWGQLSFEGPDRTHPHGHERIEPLTALFVGVTLVVLAIKLLYDAWNAVVGESPVRFSLLLVLALAFAILDMVVVYWYTIRVNRSLESPSLDALATDALNDVYTSLAAVVGVFGAGVGIPALDPLAGGLVSVLVLRQGIAIARENINYLVGRAPPADDVARIEDAVLEHSSVVGIHDLRCHYMGPMVEVEFHAEVPGNLTLEEAHDLETELQERVMELAYVGDVHVHLDPAGLGEWKNAGERSE
ncbi:MAG: cation diffusion facilitator family transporter [Halodesulfurarchaeum sp.]